MEVSDDIRQKIVNRARDKRCRGNTFTGERPCVWQPEVVISPHGMAFTPESAWQFIADRVEAGEEIEEVKLDIPYGEVAYVMLMDLDDGAARIYIKVQLLGNFILCRSFHYSTEPIRLDLDFK